MLTATVPAREPPISVGGLTLVLIFSCNFILFLYFRYINYITKSNEPETTNKDEKKKVLSKAFDGSFTSFLAITTELFRLSLVILLTYLAEYMWFFEHSTKNYSRDLFIFVLLIFFAYAFYTIKPIHDLSVLGREQTEEWKGWMQFIFLLYHYFHAEEVYNPVRVMITSYVWMTGFGNFSFFYLKQDFGWLRFVQMLWRLNFSVLLLIWAHSNTYILYYICPLHTFYFILVFIVMYIYQSINTSKWGIRIKLFFVALLIFLIWDNNFGLFDLIFGWVLGTEKIIGANSGSLWEYYFRTSLDHWSTFLGMIFALNYPITQQYFNTASRSSLAVAGVLLFALFLWWFNSQYFLEKPAYNAHHAYFGSIPVLVYIFFRNISPYIRGHVSMSLHDLGKTTLETYLLQHHIWLTSNAKSLWTLIPNNPWVNFFIATFIFFTVSKELYRLTMSLRGMILPDNKDVALKNLIGFISFVLVFYLIAYGLYELETTFFINSLVILILSGLLLYLSYTFFTNLGSPNNLFSFDSKIMKIFLSIIAFNIILIFLFPDFSIIQPSYKNTPSVSSSSSTYNSAYISNLSSESFQKLSLDCINESTKGSWNFIPCETPLLQSSLSYNSAYCLKSKWVWDESPCPFREFNLSENSHLYKKKNIAFVGDSITRNIFLNFAKTLDENKKEFVVSNTEKHQNYNYVSPTLNSTLDFIWAPYVDDVISLINNDKKFLQYDLVVMNPLLWDALKPIEVNEYNTKFNKFISTLSSKLSNNNNLTKKYFWLLPTKIVDYKLAEAKVDYLSTNNIELFKRVVKQATSNPSFQNLIDQFYFIDPINASQNMESETVDGIHYTDKVYAVISQFISNSYAFSSPSTFTPYVPVPAKKPYSPKPTGSMSFPDYGLLMLGIIFIMLFTMDAFYGFTFLSLLVFNKSFDWEAAYSGLHAKILRDGGYVYGHSLSNPPHPTESKTSNNEIELTQTNNENNNTNETDTLLNKNNV